MPRWMPCVSGMEMEGVWFQSHATAAQYVVCHEPSWCTDEPSGCTASLQQPSVASVWYTGTTGDVFYLEASVGRRVQTNESLVT